MSTPSAEISENEPQRAAATPVPRHLTRTALLTLIRRELWEHASLWRVPLVVSGLLLLVAVPASINFHLDVDPDAPWFDSEHRAALFAVGEWILTVPQFLVMSIVLPFYLLDCLYAERKDRSILFWKSLPVSDGATVGSKLLAALVVVPLGLFVLQMITGLAFTAIWDSIAAARHTDAPVVWDSIAWIKLQALIFIEIVAASLWYAPLAGYCLLVSAWARRNVFLWAVLPPILAMILERMAFGTHYFGNLVGYRAGGVWELLGLTDASAQSMLRFGEARVVSPSALLGHLDLIGFLTNIDLWLGLVVTGAFAFGAARIRRYRDDS
jgi:ABC-2 type transport system permease protein